MEENQNERAVVKVENRNFYFENMPVRVILDEQGEPWWVTKDTCEILEISKYRDAVSRLDDDERGSVKVDTPGGPQEMSVINESGLYTLIIRSNKPQAKPFRRWVTHEVLPSIRKTGAYVKSSQPSFAKGGQEVSSFAQGDREPGDATLFKRPDRPPFNKGGMMDDFSRLMYHNMYKAIGAYFQSHRRINPPVTAEQDAQMKEMAKSGMLASEIARKIGFSASCVRKRTVAERRLYWNEDGSPKAVH